MKIKLEINGTNQIILTPETDIERVVLATMAESADKGRAVSFVGEWPVSEHGSSPVITRVIVGVPA